MKLIGNAKNTVVEQTGHTVEVFHNGHKTMQARVDTVQDAYKLASHETRLAAAMAKEPHVYSMQAVYPERSAVVALNACFAGREGQKELNDDILDADLAMWEHEGGR